jgi:hypothetical protein
MADIALQLGTVESPCVSICRLDDSGVCVGCFRTADEIASWLSYSDERRREIIEALPERAGRHFEEP